MELKQYQGTSKNGKSFTAYYVAIGEYRTPLFFPSKIELMYINSVINKNKKHIDVIDDLEEQLSYEN